MALSDTCYESLAELGDSVNRYFDWGYDNAHISGVIDAMFALANVGVRLDMLEFVSNENIELIVGRAVVLALLHETDITDVIEHEAALIALANVATVNVLFARALVLIEDWLRPKKVSITLLLNIRNSHWHAKLCSLRETSARVLQPKYTERQLSKPLAEMSAAIFRSRSPRAQRR